MIGPFGRRSAAERAPLAALATALPGWRLVAASTALPPSASGEGKSPLLPATLRALRRRLRSSDAVIFTEGAPFRASGGRPRPRPLDELILTCALALAAKGLGKPVAVVGATGERLEGRHTRRLARILVQAADLLVFRDERAADTIAASGVPGPFRVAAEPSWTLVGGQGDRAPRAQALVALCCDDACDLLDRLAAPLAAVAELGLEVALQPWDSPGRGCSAEAAGRLAARLEGARLLSPPRDLAEAQAASAGSRAVIGCCAHALVPAAAAGVPFIALGDEPAGRALARRLDQPVVGSPEADCGLVAAVADAMAAPPAAERVAAERARAHEAFALLQLLLSRGGSAAPEQIAGLPLHPGS